MSSLFAVPDWDDSKKDVQYDFQKKKIKPQKGPKPEQPQKPLVLAPQNAGKQKNQAKNNQKEKPKQKQEKQQQQTPGSKKDKKQPDAVAKPSLAIPMKAKDKKNAKNQGTSMDKLKDSLKASRFRFLNECLYKSKSAEAVKMFKEDPEAFSVYHEGYRQQVAHWPTNPLDRIIKAIRKMPKDLVIADFGCGDAKLAESVSNKVYSLDLVANKPEVTACDMAKTPLQSQTVNVAVFCLSLMGTNLRDFLVEANRVLKTGGTLKVAEVKSRFENVDEFLQHVQSCGFQLLDKDVKGEYFYFFNFKKIADTTKYGNQFSLKPCLYKKR